MNTLFGFGEREFMDARLVGMVLAWAHETYGPFERFVSGGAEGADKLCEAWAKGMNIETVIYHADWERYGRSAGAIRTNQLIADLRSEETTAIGFMTATRMGIEDLGRKVGKGTQITCDLLQRAGFSYKIVTADGHALEYPRAVRFQPPRGFDSTENFDRAHGDGERRHKDTLASTAPFRPMKESLPPTMKAINCKICNAKIIVRDGTTICDWCSYNGPGNR